MAPACGWPAQPGSSQCAQGRPPAPHVAPAPVTGGGSAGVEGAARGVLQDIQRMLAGEEFRKSCLSTWTSLGTSLLTKITFSTCQAHPGSLWQGSGRACKAGPITAGRQCTGAGNSLPTYMACDTDVVPAREPAQGASRYTTLSTGTSMGTSTKRGTGT